jgi:cyclopropane fatty-acyl-phospholipid synthase-like methyltransferase
MATGQEFGEQWRHGARDWASLVEPHFRPLYEAVHDRLEIGKGTRLLDVGCGPGGQHSFVRGAVQKSRA